MPEDKPITTLDEAAEFNKFKEWWFSIYPSTINPVLVYDHIEKYFKPQWQSQQKETKPIEDGYKNPLKEMEVQIKEAGFTEADFPKEETKPVEDNKCPYEKAVCEYYELNHDTINEYQRIQDDFCGLVNLVCFFDQKYRAPKPVEDKENKDPKNIHPDLLSYVAGLAKEFKEKGIETKGNGDKQ